MQSIAALKNHIAKLKPSFAGRLLSVALPKSKKVILNNMEIAFGEALTPAERQKLMTCYLGHMIKTAVEIISVRFLSQQQILNHVEVRGLEHAAQALQKGRGLLLFSAHMGNWEFAPWGGFMQCEVLHGRTYIIRKKISNRFLEKLLFGRYEQAGVRVLEKSNSLRPIFRTLANNGVIVIPFDQYANPKTRGILANFFGRPAGTYKGLAKIAQKTGAAAVMVIPYRLPSGKHVLEFFPEVEWIKNPDPEVELRLNTEAYNQSIERVIWDHPEQWLWRQRRWRS